MQTETIAEILNRINDTLDDLGCQAVGYDNTGEFLTVLISEVDHES